MSKSSPTVISDPPNLYSKQDVASHNTETDLWVIIEGRVFDLTDYLDSHPGGKKSRYPKCWPRTPLSSEVIGVPPWARCQDNDIRNSR